MIFPKRNVVFVALMAAWFAAPAPAAEPEVWTLESATQRVLESAPEQRATDAEVAARAAELKQAGSWPNPNIELRADDKLGQEDGRGGTDLTQLAVSQPLPLRRLARERRVAELRLAGREQDRRLRRLELERATAAAFHDLQLAQARLDLARTRLTETESYPGAAGAADRLVRYLAPLERARLAILREEANQAVAAAAREHEQAAIVFRARLALPPGAPVAVAPLAEAVAPPAIEALERDLDGHPVLGAARRAQQAAEANIDAAQSQRFADPALNLFRERDFLNGARRDVSGVGVSVQVPLWNLNAGGVDRARAEALRARTEYEIAARDVRARLDRARAELARTREQADRVRASLLEPARRLNELARRSFAAGEANVLTLIDAANSYFDAQARYAELLARSQEAQSELRLAAGLSLLDTKEAQP